MHVQVILYFESLIHRHKKFRDDAAAMENLSLEPAHDKAAFAHTSSYSSPTRFMTLWERFRSVIRLKFHFGLLWSAAHQVFLA